VKKEQKQKNVQPTAKDGILEKRGEIGIKKKKDTSGKKDGGWGK